MEVEGVSVASRGYTLPILQNYIACPHRKNHITRCNCHPHIKLVNDAYCMQNCQCSVVAKLAPVEGETNQFELSSSSDHSASYITHDSKVAALRRRVENMMTAIVGRLTVYTFCERMRR